MMASRFEMSGDDFTSDLLKAQSPDAHDWEQGKFFAKLKIKPVKSNSETEYFFNNIIFGLSECWFWCGYVDKLGYGRWFFKREHLKAHRKSWQLFRNEIPEGKMILHHCDVRNCVNPDHLYVGTQRDNMRDCSNRKRFNHKPRHGEENPVAKLTTSEVLLMRSIREEKGLSYKKISQEFGVSTMTAYRAITKKSWMLT